MHAYVDATPLAAVISYLHTSPARSLSIYRSLSYASIGTRKNYLHVESGNHINFFLSFSAHKNENPYNFAHCALWTMQHRRLSEHARTHRLYYCNSKWPSWKLKLNWGGWAVSMQNANSSSSLSPSFQQFSTIFSLSLSLCSSLSTNSFSFWLARQRDAASMVDFFSCMNLLLPISFWQFCSVVNVSSWSISSYTEMWTTLDAMRAGVHFSKMHNRI